MSSETPTTPSPAANPHSLTFTLDEFLASVYAVQTLFVELYQDPDPNNADYYNPSCWIELVSSPPLTALLSHVASLHTAQIPFPTFIAPLLSESDVLDGTILQHLYSAAQEAEPDFVLSKRAAEAAIVDATNVMFFDGWLIFSFEVGFPGHDGESDEFDGKIEFDGEFCPAVGPGFDPEINPDGEFNWELMSEYDSDDEFETAAPSYDGIVAFVDALPTVDVSTIPQDELRCPFCWGDFGAQDGCEGGDVKQVQCCNKRFGRACLIEAIESSTHCPNCRRDFNITASAHASATA
jgi:hypothetical protein